MALVEVLCLANSRKHGGRCIAGLRTKGDGWVRPVSGSEDGTLFPHHYILVDGSEPRVLDLLEIDLGVSVPRPNQPENFLMGALPWRLVSRPAPRELLPLLQQSLVRGPSLLGSTGDEIAYEQLVRRPARASLALVAPEELAWQVEISQLSRKPQVRARFLLAGQRYSLVVTDPECHQRLCRLQPDLYPPIAAGLRADERLLLTLSLGEPFHGNCFKLVAGLVRVPENWWADLAATEASPTAGEAETAELGDGFRVKDRDLAGFARSRGTPLAARLSGAFEAALQEGLSQDETIQRLRDSLEVLLRGRTDEAPRR